MKPAIPSERTSWPRTRTQERDSLFKNSHGEVVHSAGVGAGLGTWGNYRVYALDFSVATPDTYSIIVAGPPPAVSPTFRVDTPANLYSAPLANTLSFFENQRDGADFVPSVLRPTPAHLNDQKAKVYGTPEFYGPEGSRIKSDLRAKWVGTAEQL
jgi:hypothetical protein